MAKKDKKTSDGIQVSGAEDFTYSFADLDEDFESLNVNTVSTGFTVDGLTFTNEEELMLIPEAEEIFPFLLQSKLTEQGANFQQGTAYLERVVRDGKLITGQNPWSVWMLAELVVEELGYQPKQRTRTPEEHSIDLLITYNQHGYDAASEQMSVQPQSYQMVTLLMHGIFAFMQGEISKGTDILSLANHLKELVG